SGRLQPGREGAGCAPGAVRRSSVRVSRCATARRKPLIDNHFQSVPLTGQSASIYLTSLFRAASSGDPRRSRKTNTVQVNANDQSARPAEPPRRREEDEGAGSQGESAEAGRLHA